MLPERNGFGNAIQELSQPDPYGQERYGDGLVTFLHELTGVIESAFAPSFSKKPEIIEVALRALKVLFGSLLMVPVAIPAGLGIVMKSLQDKPLVSDNFSDQNIIIWEQYPYIEPDPNFSLDNLYIPDELYVDIIKHLPLFEKIRLSIISKKFKDLVAEPTLWHSYINEQEIYQANHLCPECLDGYNLGVRKKDDSLEQITAYLKTKSDYRFFNYLSCNMKGGPLAFAKIPHLEISCLEDIQPSDMRTSIIRGTDLGQHRSLFLALHVISATKITSTVLVFFKRDFEDKTKSTTQLKNDYIKKNTIKLRYPNHLKYVLAIINREDLSERGSEFDEILDPTLRLVDHLVLK